MATKKITLNELRSIVKRFIKEENNIDDVISKLIPYEEELKKTADRLFQDGTPTTQFMRILNQDIQYYAKEDIASSNDFYTDRNEMKKILHWLGYVSTEFGIAKLNK